MNNIQLQNFERAISQLTSVLSTIGIVILGVLLLAFLLRYLWNTTIPDVFDLKKIDYWQAFKLLIICIILFGGLIR